MKPFSYLTLFFTFIMSYSNAQQNIAGEYYLQGVMETASGFKLNNDSTFEFFFTYGALDRYGSGKWRINGDRIILNSKPLPGKDFKLANTTAVDGKLTVLKIEDANTSVYRMVYCRLKSAGQDTILNFEEDGTLVLPYQPDSIELLTELCPERASAFVIDKTPNTYTFNFQPWILEVFFNNDVFYYTKDYMEGKSALLNDKVYRFAKQSQSNE